MELSELTAYAEEKHHIREQHKWSDSPGFSVLTDPATGKWAALLMRQWDTETGTEITVNIAREDAERVIRKYGKEILKGPLC